MPNLRLTTVILLYLTVSIPLHMFADTVTTNSFHAMYRRALNTHRKLEHALEKHINALMTHATWSLQSTTGTYSVKDLLIQHCLKQHQELLTHEHTMIAKLNHTPFEFINADLLRSQHPIISRYSSALHRDLDNITYAYYADQTYRSSHQHELSQQQYLLQLKNSLQKNIDLQSFLYRQKKRGIRQLATHDHYITTTMPGKVEGVYHTPGYGYNVVIRHPNKRITLYGKVQEPLVHIGDTLQAGMHIGTHRDYYQHMSLKD